MTVRQDILQHLKINGVQPDGSCSGTITLPESFIGFQGHFPENPTLPGVCEIMILQLLLERAGGFHTEHAVIQNAKFFAPVGPNKTLQLSCSRNGDSIICNITSGEKKICSLKLLAEVASHEA